MNVLIKKIFIRSAVSLTLIVSMTFSVYAFEPGQTINTATVGTEKPWLYFQNSSVSHDGTLTADQLKAMGNNLRNLKNDLEEAGIKFMVVVAPDKDEIYPEYLPEGYMTQTVGRAGQLTAYMEANYPDVPFMFPTDILLAVKNRDMEKSSAADSAVSGNTAKDNAGKVSEASGSVDDVCDYISMIPAGSTVPLYYESDTHWGPYGSYAASVPIIVRAADLCGKTVSVAPRTFAPGGVMTGDLQKFLGDSTGEYNTTEQIPSVPFAFEQTDEIINEDNGDPVLIKTVSTKSDAADLNVFLAGDSFRISLTAPVAESFKSATVVNRFHFNTEMLLEDKPDILIYMICERYIDELSMLPGYNTVSLPMPEKPEKK